jgi:hypothetical protein
LVGGLFSSVLNLSDGLLSGFATLFRVILKEISSPIAHIGRLAEKFRGFAALFIFDFEVVAFLYGGKFVDWSRSLTA